MLVGFALLKNRCYHVVRLTPKYLANPCSNSVKSDLRGGCIFLYQCCHRSQAYYLRKPFQNFSGVVSLGAMSLVKQLVFSVSELKSMSVT